MQRRRKDARLSGRVVAEPESVRYPIFRERKIPVNERFQIWLSIFRFLRRYFFFCSIHSFNKR
ncbi:MAG: hypothetical protein APR55_11235 [Methanolinea sp. SDB]|nr:MAG: hypothetical protein APR55_11235 [Methanolinea sp. SDB]